MALTAISLVMAFIVAARLEHLVASAWWVVRYGKACAKRLSDLGLLTAGHPEEAWAVYRMREFGGSNPFLFFGIKSYKLLAWSKESGGRKIWIRATCSRLVRPLWRFYTFAPVVTCYLIIVSSRFRDSAADWIWLATAFLLIASTIVLAAEGTLSAILVHSWGHVHHRQAPALSAALGEVGAAMIALVVAVVSSIGLIFVAAAEFHAFLNAPGSSSAGLLLFSVYSALGCLALNFPEVTGSIGYIVGISLVAQWISYVFIFWGALASFAFSGNSEASKVDE